MSVIVMRVVGALYLLSGAWCALVSGEVMTFLQFSPGGEPTPRASSEFLSVYGGLQVGVGLALWCCSLHAAWISGGLIFGTLLSCTLAAFRGLSMVLYPPDSAVMALAVLEWGIAVALVLACLTGRPSSR